MTPPLRRGEFVRLTIGAWSIEAFVGLVSENGRAVIVQFDGAAPVDDGRAYALGILPLLENDDGTWIEIGRQTLVQVERWIAAN
jgi:hypothetical protein